MREKRMFKLGGRLSACAKLVRKDSVIADIGTDHAMLPVYLIHNGICKTAIASDIARKPYEGAVNLVKEYGFTDEIDVRLGGGLDTIAPDEVTDIVIAGMGGELITQILETAPWTKDEKYNFILQPMSKVSDLRRWLYANGFEIQSETAVTDTGKDYTVINSRYTGVIMGFTELDVYAGKLIPCKNESAKNLLNKQAKMLEDKLIGLQKKGDNTAVEQMRNIINELRRLSEE